MDATSYPNQGTLHRERMRFERDFTQLPNRWLRDKRLSRAARGLLAELMTHDIGYEVSLTNLAAAGVEGRDAIRTMVSDLEGRGYLHRVRERRKGRFGGAVWVLQDPFEAVDNPASVQLAGLENPRSTNVGISNVGSTNVGSTASENPTTIEDQIKNTSTHVPAQPQEPLGRPVDNLGTIIWSDDRCPGNWRDGVHELGGNGKCRHCFERPHVERAG